MSYYSSLDKVYQNFFDKFGFKPENDFEADAFLRGVYNLDKDKEITVNLSQPVVKNNRVIDKIVANQQNFLDLFYPAVWQQLNMQQKMAATVFAFNGLAKQDITIKKQRPQLVFICSNTGYDGLCYLKGKQNIIDISLNTFFINNQSKPMLLLASLKHELTHCKQNAVKQKIIDKINANNKRGVKNSHLTDYQLNLLLEFGQYFNDCNDIAREKYLPFEANTFNIIDQKEYDYICYWEKVKNKYDFRSFLTLFYLVDSSEDSAFNKSANYIASVEKYYADNFNGYKSQQYIPAAEQIVQSTIDELNTKYKFKLKPEDVAEFKKINEILSGLIDKKEIGGASLDILYVDNKNFYKSKSWTVFKKVLNIYKDKCVLNPIPNSTVEQFKQHKINALDSTDWLNF